MDHRLSGVYQYYPHSTSAQTRSKVRHPRARLGIPKFLFATQVVNCHAHFLKTRRYSGFSRNPDLAIFQLKATMPSSMKRTKTKGTSSKRQKRDYSPKRSSSRSLGRPLSSNTNTSLFQKGGGVEKKWLDTSVTMVVTGVGTATVTLLNGLSQGTTSNTRIGSRIEVKNVQFKYNFQGGDSATGITPIRVKIVYDKESNGAAPLATDIMASDAIDGLNNLNTAGRFITMFDQTWQPNAGASYGVSAGSSQAQLLEGYVKCNLPTKYNGGNAGTVADISSGSIYVLCWTNGVTFGGAGLDNAARFRIRYTDI